ncbi:hypothetical protein RB653_002054 [Dictyostelium firmibasis]|uniref:WD40 repeat-containing protein n=1 Tax=Dictyostelium firmibasis TaxID=79012 RepID=A0AAN7YSA9_9MYCE
MSIKKRSEPEKKDPTVKKQTIAKPVKTETKTVSKPQPTKQQPQPQQPNKKQPQQPTKQQTTKQQPQPIKSALKKTDPLPTTTKSEPLKTDDNNNKSTKKAKEVVTQSISVGCYENSIIGYDVTYVGNVAEEGFEVDLQMKYGYSSHTGCVKALASTKNVLVSSSTDETLKVYDLKRGVEFGQLSKHEGFVTSIQFYKNTHMFAGSMDNTISVWRVSDWECLKIMSGAKGAINSISIHPSGKVALSVSKDRRLFLWDLTKGTSAHFLKFKTEGFIVQWSPSGDHYAVVFKDKVVVYNSSNFEELVSLDFNLQVLAIKFFDDNTLMVGGEDKLLTFIDYKNGGKITKQLMGHENRIKGIDTLKFKGVDKTYVVTISSDGLIIVWNPMETILPVGCAETGFRLTSVSIAQVSQVKSINSDDEDEDEDNENDEDEEVDSEEEEAIANQPTKKMKVNIEMDEDDEDEEEDEEEIEGEEECDDDDEDEDDDYEDADEDEEDE